MATIAEDNGWNWHNDSPVRKEIFEEAIAKARKSRPDLFSARALLLAGDVLAFGETKHPGEPWKEMTVSDHLGAVMRHVLKWQSGELVDSETNRSHLVHALVRLAMAVDREAQS